MPSKYPILKPKEVIAKLETFGFRFVSQKGSHKKYTDGKRVVIVPDHDELAKGTLKSILSQAGIDLEDFMK
jgi:predicted RNA binding protein YcfA (HicA-like mRNA interferase family)